MEEKIMTEKNPWVTSYPAKPKKKGYTIKALHEEIERVKKGKSRYELSRTQDKKIRGLERKITRIQARTVAKRNRKFGRVNIIVVEPRVGSVGGRVDMRKPLHEQVRTGQIYGVYFDNQGFSHYGGVYLVELPKGTAVGGIFSVVRPIEARNKPFFRKAIQDMRRSLKKEGLKIYIIPKRINTLRELEKSEIYYVQGDIQQKVPVKKIIKSRRKTWDTRQQKRYDTNFNKIKMQQIPEAIKKDIATLARSYKIARSSGHTIAWWIGSSNYKITFDPKYVNPQGSRGQTEVVEFIQAKYGKLFDPSRFMTTPTHISLKKAQERYLEMSVPKLGGLLRKGQPGKTRNWLSYRGQRARARREEKIEGELRWLMPTSTHRRIAEITLQVKRKTKSIPKSTYNNTIARLLAENQEKYTKEWKELVERMEKKRIRLIKYYARGAVRRKK
jgi:hypothetical protein